MKKRVAGCAARMMVENRRAYAPRVVENKRRKTQLQPKHKTQSFV